jgi:hypothetical protein
VSSMSSNGYPDIIRIKSKRPALVTLTRHTSESGAEYFTYGISDPDSSGFTEITLDALVGLFRMAGIEPGGQP